MACLKVADTSADLDLMDRHEIKPADLEQFLNRIDDYLLANEEGRRNRLWQARIQEEYAVNARLLLDVKVWIALLAAVTAAVGLYVKEAAEVSVGVGVLLIVAVLLVLVGATLALKTYKTRGTYERAVRMAFEDIDKNKQTTAAPEAPGVWSSVRKWRSVPPASALAGASAGSVWRRSRP